MRKLNLYKGMNLSIFVVGVSVGFLETWSSAFEEFLSEGEAYVGLGRVLFET